jgi:diguanylate cyclase (GGDEF)-like protein
MASYGVFGAAFGALDHGATSGQAAVARHIARRMSEGRPIFSIGPFEVHGRGFADWAERMAFFDRATELRNKAGGQEALNREVARADREGTPVSLINVDLDNFKPVNDKLGHATGDKVLLAWADWLKRNFRATDYPSRPGGDEFEILAPNTSLDQAQRLAEMIEHTRIAARAEPTRPEHLIGNYPKELARISEINRTVTPTEGQTLPELAKQLLEERLPLTGERVTPEAVNAEVARLGQRTGLNECDVLGADSLTVYNDADISVLAERAAFRFVPEFGQLLKIGEKPIEPAQLEEALRIQRSTTAEQKPLLGEIMVRQGYATRQQVDEAFAHQSALLEAARLMRERAGLAPAVDPMVFRRPAVPSDLLFKEPIVRYRLDVPDVLRPQLEAGNVRQLQAFEIPAEGEVVVGASTGAAELQPGETAEAFQRRADRLMLDKKEVRKQLGLRHDRVERGTVPVVSDSDRKSP